MVHETTYEYSSQVSSSRQIAHLTPRATAWQQLVSHRLTVDPIASERSEGIDYFGNRYVSFFVEEPHGELIVRAESEVIVASQGITPETESPPWEEAVVERGAWGPGLDLDAEQYRVPSPAIPLLPKARAYAARQLHARHGRGSPRCWISPSASSANSPTTPKPPPSKPACSRCWMRSAASARTTRT